MSQEKILDWKQRSLIATGLSTFIAYKICLSYFHLRYCNQTIFVFMLPPLMVFIYVCYTAFLNLKPKPLVECRNVERKSFLNRYMDFFYVLSLAFLTVWIPILLLNYLLPYHKYSDSVVALASLSIFGIWASMTVTLLRKLGFCSDFEHSA